MGSRALVADSKETWVCSYLSLTLYSVLARTPYSAGGGLPRVDALAMLPVHPLAGMGDAS